MKLLLIFFYKKYRFTERSSNFLFNFCAPKWRTIFKDIEFRLDVFVNYRKTDGVYCNQLLYSFVTCFEVWNTKCMRSYCQKDDISNVKQLGYTHPFNQEVMYVN